MPNPNENGGDPQKTAANNEQQKDTFTKEQVEELINKAVTDTKTEFQDHIKKLNEENTKRRLDSKGLKELLAETLGIDKEKATETDIVNQKIAEIAKQNKELAEKYDAAEKKAVLLEKTANARELAVKAGLKEKAIKLMDLNAENLDAEIARIAEEFPELKDTKSVGTGSNPPGGGRNTSQANPYKAESFNLTQQFQLEQVNPALAAKYKAEAGL